MYLKRNILFDFNFMTVNTIFSINEITGISYNYSMILIHILIVLIMKIIDWRIFDNVKINKYIKKI